MLSKGSVLSLPKDLALDELCTNAFVHAQPETRTPDDAVARHIEVRIRFTKKGVHITVKDGGWDWQGFGNIDGQKALVEGTARYVAGTATGGMSDEYIRAFSNALIGEYVKKRLSGLSV